MTAAAMRARHRRLRRQRRDADRRFGLVSVRVVAAFEGFSTTLRTAIEHWTTHGLPTLRAAIEQLQRSAPIKPAMPN